MGSRIGLAHGALVGGALAALVTSVLIWVVTQSGLLLLLGIPLDQPLTTAWIYKRMIWGGIWGLLFLLPWLKAWPQRKRGLVWGVIPSLVTLLFFSPFYDGLGYLGLAWGWGWPVTIVVFNLLWGFLAGAWLDATKVAPSAAAPADTPPGA